MNVRLALASVWVPGFLERRALRELLQRTAEAFQVAAPDRAGRSYRACLQTFAEFTATQAEAVSGKGDAVRGRLRATAHDLGRKLRRALGVRTRAEGMHAARIVYRMLGIDFEGRTDGARGTIVIRACAFSRLYTPRACALVSGLDEGLLAGLLGEGTLEFTSRMTEGCDRCAATFRFEGAP